MATQLSLKGIEEKSSFALPESATHLYGLWKIVVNQLKDTKTIADDSKSYLVLDLGIKLIDFGNTLLDTGKGEIGNNLTIESELDFRLLIDEGFQALDAWILLVDCDTPLFHRQTRFRNDYQEFTQRITQNFSANEDDFAELVDLKHIWPQGSYTVETAVSENWEPSRSIQLSTADWKSLKAQLENDKPNRKFEAAFRRAKNNKNFEIIDRV